LAMKSDLSRSFATDFVNDGLSSTGYDRLIAKQDLRSKMAQITIADDLLAQIQRALPESASTDGFVEAAVREKLAVEERRAEFYQLSEETRRRMEEKGISESEILGDFEVFREGLTLD
jgi:hypothetical protein